MEMISVKDKMPEKDGYYLVLDSEGQFQKLCYFLDSNTNDRRWDSHNGYITHYCELPTIPEEKRESDKAWDEVQKGVTKGISLDILWAIKDYLEALRKEGKL